MGVIYALKAFYGGVSEILSALTPAVIMMTALAVLKQYAFVCGHVAGPPDRRFPIPKGRHIFITIALGLGLGICLPIYIIVTKERPEKTVEAPPSKAVTSTR